jgi:metal-sulfur cluster biosynthetic enzyme
MTEPANSSSNFDGAPTRPEMTEEQIALASEVEEYMHDVIDPELGINVVDLGLVYDVWVEEDDGEKVAVVNMTLTSPACPLTDVIEDQATQAVLGNTECEALELNWVWMPPWGPHMISDDGREQLRAIGFAV